MILKASQRGSGQDLAAHLMRVDDNEHVLLHELRGFASDNLKGAFKEAEAVSRGTACRQYLFSLSLNPPEQERVPVEIFEATVDRIEKRLGLQGQPRALVFHEKEGRRHAHCVWSRIDADTMTAKQMSFFKTKLNALSRELYLEHGWKMPRGLENSAERNPTNFTLAEWQQAKRQQIDPRWLKSTLQDCWKISDDRKSFARALEDRGFFLAKGDKRGHVVLDHQGEVYSLPRMLGLKTKEVRARLGAGDDLPSVADAQKTIGARMTPAIRRHVAESRERFKRQSEHLGKRKSEMTDRHRAARDDLRQRQKDEWDRENVARSQRLPKGLRGLWHRLTGEYRKVRALNEAEARETRGRHINERQDLFDAQRGERSALQSEIKQARQTQAQQLSELRQEIGRFLRFSKSRTSQDRGRDISSGLKLGR
ncbi:MAG: relaxase [Bauldia sp.]|nr:relaxase [Bauldia sp.]